jgi:hypothetical protein
VSEKETPGPFEKAWRARLAEMRRDLADLPAEVERRLAEKRAGTNHTGNNPATPEDPPEET